MTIALLSPAARRFPAVAVAMLALIGGGASAQTPVRAAPGTSASCEQWAVFSTAGNASGRIEVCSSVLKDMPRLREQIALLNQRAANDADARRDLQRFAESLNQMARQLKVQDTKGMLESLVAKLEQSRKASDGEVMDELARLRLGMGNLQRSLQAMKTNEQAQREVASAMAGGVGASVAQLDFDGANKILAELLAIKATLGGMAEPAEARVLLASDRRRALQQMERFESAGARERCKVVYQELAPVLEASAQAEQNGQFGAARNLLMTVYSRAAQATAELQSLDRLKAGEAAKQIQDEDDLARHLIESQRRLGDLERSVKYDEESDSQLREMQREQQERSEERNRTELLPSEKLAVTVKGWLEQTRLTLADAEALPQATEEEKAQRRTAIDQAKTNIAVSERQAAEVVARAAQERTEYDKVIREQRESITRGDAERASKLQYMKAARDHLAAAIAKARVDGRQEPAKAVDDLRLAESEASDISNGQTPMPRPRRAKTPSFVLPNPICA